MKNYNMLIGLPTYGERTHIDMGMLSKYYLAVAVCVPVLIPLPLYFLIRKIPSFYIRCDLIATLNKLLLKNGVRNG